MKKKFSMIAVVLLASLCAVAQTPAPTPAPLGDPNSGIHIDLSASYSFINSAPTISGSDSQSATRATLRIPVTDRFSGVYEMILLPGQNAQINLGGLEYRRNTAEFLKSPALKFDPRKYDVFVYGALGGKRQDKSTTPAFAFLVGGGIDYKLTNSVVVRAVDIAWLKSDLQSKGLVLSNHLQFAPGIRLRW